jgi:hypothetical protein
MFSLTHREELASQYCSGDPHTFNQSINQSINRSINHQMIAGYRILASLHFCCETDCEGTIGSESFRLTALRFHWWVSVPF